MPISRSRDDQIAQFYARHADRLRRTVAAKTAGLDHDLIDEACAYGWEKLLGRDDIDLTSHTAFWWLYRIALRQAWRLSRARCRERAAGGLSGTDEYTDEDATEPISREPDVADVVANRVECAVVREVLGELHWRERRELLLYAHGLSYQEIARVTGTSYTAVNKWLARGKKALREARKRKSGGLQPSEDPEAQDRRALRRSA